MQKDFNQAVDELEKGIDQIFADANKRLEKMLDVQYGPLSKAMKTGNREELRKALTPVSEPELSSAQRATVYAAAQALQQDGMVRTAGSRPLEDLVDMVKAELWQGLAKGATSFEGAVSEAARRVRERVICGRG